jgi:glycosyltransferase involved in cell wall biosynthesis
MPDVSLLIPAYNEESTIEKVISEHYKMLKNLKFDGIIHGFEIIVLNDGSTDDTENKLTLLSREISDLKVLKNNSPSGLQNAYLKLSHQASKDWFIVVPGDDQWSSAATYDVIKRANELSWKCVVIGARIHKRKIYGLSRSFISTSFRSLAAFCLRQDVIDPGSIKLMPTMINSFKLITRSPVQEIEKLVIAKDVGKYEIVTIRVQWQDRVAGSATGNSLANIINSIIEIPRIIRQSNKIRESC